MSAKHPYNIQWLSDVEMPLANKFYRDHGFRGKAKRHESCAVVKDKNKQIVACAYLRDYNLRDHNLRDHNLRDHNLKDYNTFNLLSGVAVEQAVQGQGIARLLLGFMIARFVQQTYTFPYEHLIPFYSSIGFQMVNIEQVENSVNELYCAYLKQGRRIELMKWR